MSDRLWAPWRMQLIQGPKSPDGCVLCGYASRPIARDGRVLARRPTAYVVLNKYPYAAGHLMVVPRRHAGDLSELDAGEYVELWRLVRDAVPRLRSATGAHGVNLGVNLGEAAGAGIHEHLHVHLVPRWRGDSNFMPVLADVRVLPEYLEATWDRLAPAFADLTEEAERP
jgi:ATP adenylyltransferase